MICKFKILTEKKINNICNKNLFLGDERTFISDKKPNKEIIKIITDWCKDDKGRNVMYKVNGEERYPEFKLYKMIARTVHNHTPNNVLENSFFDRYVVGRKGIKKRQKIMNIDNIPEYTKE